MPQPNKILSLPKHNQTARVWHCSGMHVAGTLHWSCCSGKGYMLILGSRAIDLFSCLGISMCCFNHKNIKHSNVTAERDADCKMFPFPQISGTYSNYLDDSPHPHPQGSVRLRAEVGGASLSPKRCSLLPLMQC